MERTASDPNAPRVVDGRQPSAGSDGSDGGVGSDGSPAPSSPGSARPRRRFLTALAASATAALSGCSFLTGGGSSAPQTTAGPTPTPDPITDDLYAEVTVDETELNVELTSAGEESLRRVDLVGPIVGGGDTAEKTIYPGEETRTDAADDGGPSRPLPPSEVTRAPVYRTADVAESGGNLGFEILREEFGPEARNYRSGIYNIVGYGDDEIAAQRRVSLVPLLSLVDGNVGDSGELLLTLRNTGTGPCYPAYGTVIGAESRNRGSAEIISGGNGIRGSTILPPTEEAEYAVAPREDDPLTAPFGYARTNETRDEDVGFDEEASAYCTGTGEFSHGLAVILGLVSGGYVGARFTAILDGEPDLFRADPDDRVLCERLTITSSLPQSFTPVRWPGGRDELLAETGDGETAENATADDLTATAGTETSAGDGVPGNATERGTASGDDRAGTVSETDATPIASAAPETSGDGNTSGDVDRRSRR